MVDIKLQNMAKRSALRSTGPAWHMEVAMSRRVTATVSEGEGEADEATATTLRLSGQVGRSRSATAAFHDAWFRKRSLPAGIRVEITRRQVYQALSMEWTRIHKGT